MSTEQARGQKVDARTDLFSLGVVFYELLTGKRPFSGVTRNHVLVAILDEAPLPLTAHWPAAPAALQAIVSRALSKDRDERYSTAQELLIQLKQLKDDLALAAQLERGRASGELRPPPVTRDSAVTTDPEASRKTTGALALLRELRQRKFRSALA